LCGKGRLCGEPSPASRNREEEVARALPRWGPAVLGAYEEQKEQTQGSDLKICHYTNKPKKAI